MMKTQTSIFLLVCCIFVNDAVLAGGDNKFQEYGAVNCESEMAYLDNYAITLQNKLQMQAYIVIYGGRRDTSRNEIKVRNGRIKRYLTSERGVDSKRIKIIDGGFRERFTVELWVVPQDQTPKPTPTVSSSSIRYRKRKFGDDCSIYY